MLNKEIAARLSLTPCTVNQYVSRILAKSESRNRAEAAAKWVTGKIAAKGQGGVIRPLRGPALQTAPNACGALACDLWSTE
jgi:hypothetical protein